MWVFLNKKLILKFLFLNANFTLANILGGKNRLSL